MTGPTYFFNNGNPVRRKRPDAMIIPALPKAPATAEARPERTEPQRGKLNRSIPDRPAETAAAAGSVGTFESPVAQPQNPEPEPPAPTAADPWQTVLAALREDHEQRNQEWRRQQQEHQDRMKELQQQMKAEVEEAFRRVLES